MYYYLFSHMTFKTFYFMLTVCDRSCLTTPQRPFRPISDAHSFLDQHFGITSHLLICYNAIIKLDSNSRKQLFSTNSQGSFPEHNSASKISGSALVLTAKVIISHLKTHYSYFLLSDYSVFVGLLIHISESNRNIMKMQSL